MAEENTVEEIPEWKIKQINKMPIIESRIGKSKDGRFVIHKVVITDIKPVEYYEKVMG
ncbi:MAG: hypothetical protein PWP03_204 [Candidatus Woesearchaeota archaeon]|nr:hypothetical protein [Candidatus Woesearchaeota archaeon]MDN5327566.1 hypothetical protein [Candidatus Woesearchaeota archaeon]